MVTDKSKMSLSNILALADMAVAQGKAELAVDILKNALKDVVQMWIDLGEELLEERNRHGN